MTGFAAWIGRAVAAARLAGDRADLWIPGALGALAYLAWLPLLAVVAGPPRVGDLAFVGARLFSSSLYPWNVVLLAGAATLVVLIACLVAALGEAALLGSLGRSDGRRSLSHDTGSAFTVILAASLPAAAALAGLVAGAVLVGRAEFGAPDLRGPLLLRILGSLAPLLVVLAAAVLLGQAFGAAAMRRAVGPAAGSIGAALRGGLGDVLRHPTRRIGLALGGTLAELVSLGLAFALLRVLWAPVAVDLAAGRLLSPENLLLLVGFVAIWLALVLVAGALHAWVSAWWSLELGPTVAETSPEAGGVDAAHS